MTDSKLAPQELSDFEEREQLYRQLLEDLPIAGYTCDAEGYLKLYNEDALNLWGIERGIEPKIIKDKNPFKRSIKIYP
jgi:PAS domain-containing protein